MEARAVANSTRDRIRWEGFVRGASSCFWYTKNEKKRDAENLVFGGGGLVKNEGLLLDDSSGFLLLGGWPLGWDGPSSSFCFFGFALTARNSRNECSRCCCLVVALPPAPPQLKYRCWSRIYGTTIPVGDLLPSYYAWPMFVAGPKIIKRGLIIRGACNKFLRSRSSLLLH